LSEQDADREAATDLGGASSFVVLVGDLSARETLCLPSRLATLKIDDLSVADSQHLVALDAVAILVEPDGRADDPVVANGGELRPNAWRAAASLVDLERQDLTGLVGAASRRRLSPPQMAARDPAPLCVIREQRRERAWIACAERVGCGPKLIENRLVHLAQR
jgi:hypothetical protein